MTNDTYRVPRPEGVTTDVALLLHEQGYSVFPVPMPRAGAASGQPGDGKTPDMSWRQYQSTRATADQIAKWFATPSNAAIVTGAISNLVIVDCDSWQALRWAVTHLPRTPRQVRTARGWHLYYRHPGTAVRNRARLRTDAGPLSLDVRADGGYVISPWSLHASGESYHCIGDWDAPISDVPVFSAAWLVPPPSAPVAPTSRRTISGGGATERGWRYLLATPLPEIGHGSDAEMFRLSAKLVRDMGIAPPVAVEMLDKWAGGRTGWDRAWIASKVEHALKYGAQPIGGVA